METQNSSVVNKLIILFFIDKMDVPLTEETILKACYYNNPWLEYMDCMQTLRLLTETGFIFSKKTYDGTYYYTITPDGRACLSYFYMRIPASLRAEITEFVKENRTLYRRNQEYSASYRLNPDKSYTCTLKIVDRMIKTTLNLEINVPNKKVAVAVREKWVTKAAQIYTMLYEQLVD